MRFAPFLIAMMICLAGGAQAAVKQQPQAQPAAQTATAQQPPMPASLGKIQRIVVVYLESHSFDNLYGEFPGVEGIEKAGQTSIQVSASGLPYQTLPPVVDSHFDPPAIDARFPPDLPNQPFNLAKYSKDTDVTSDMGHRFYQEQAQIDGGLMDKYVLYSGAGGLPMGYYDGESLPLAQYASRFVLGDHMFHAAFGGSFLNHFWLICGCTPVFPKAPADLVATLDAHGNLIKDGAVTPDGYAVNTLLPSAGPFAGSTDAAHRLPPQTMPTIGDRLSDKNISWTWYGAGYANAAAGHPNKLFEAYHQPFLYFVNYAPGTAGSKHLKDETDFIKAIDNNTLPAVSFWKPEGQSDEHPGYAEVGREDKHATDIVQRIETSAMWDNTMIIVTYDENGGQWDHVPPPHRDRWGDGTRVPLIVISPFSKFRFIDHTVYDTTSILRTIELRYGLAPLGPRDAAAAPLLNALN
jgi:phospholipase C